MIEQISKTVDSRREWLRKAAIMAGGVLAPSLYVYGKDEAALPNQTVRFGICADPHQDVMHDACARLQAFMDHIKSKSTDFIIQLGDFCRPYESNQPFLDIWNSYAGDHLHVLGNHDTDGGFKKEQTMAFWGMEKPYYSFDRNGWHFIVLDGNDVHDTPPPGYPRHIGDEQRKWLAEDLKNTNAPCVIFSHQSLENPDGVDNGKDVQKILEDENQRCGRKKVCAALCGHHHLDFLKELGGITYIGINSMSYYWVGGDYIHKHYADEIEEKYPYIRYTVPYRDSLFALITIEPNGRMTVEGRQSVYVPPTLEEIGHPALSNGIPISPSIADKEIRFEFLG